MQEQTQPGELHYVIDAELKDTGLVRYGTTFMPEGRVLLCHLKQQQFVDNSSYCIRLWIQIRSSSCR